MLQQCSLRFRTDPMCQTLITNEYLLKIFVILLMLDGHWLHTECSRTAEMMDLVSFFQTHIGLFVLFRWELLSQRVKSLRRYTHVRVQFHTILPLFMELISAVCLLTESLTHALVNAVVLEYIL